MTPSPGPLCAMSRAVRERRVSASALVTASIERLTRASTLNVLAEACFDDALRRGGEDRPR